MPNIKDLLYSPMAASLQSQHEFARQLSSAIDIPPSIVSQGLLEQIRLIQHVCDQIPLHSLRQIQNYQEQLKSLLAMLPNITTFTDAFQEISDDNAQKIYDEIVSSEITLPQQTYDEISTILGPKTIEDIAEILIAKIPRLNELSSSQYKAKLIVTIIEFVISIITIAVTMYCSNVSHQDAIQAHQDTIQAHLDAERAHEDFLQDIQSRSASHNNSSNTPAQSTPHK